MVSALPPVGCKGYGVANPTSWPVCGEPVAVSVNVIVPGRLTLRGDRTFVNRTVTEQLAPGARLVPVQLSDPATMLKNQVKMPPPVPFATVTFEMAKLVPPAEEALAKVTMPVPLNVPVPRVIVNGLGEIVAVPRFAELVPIS